MTTITPLQEARDIAKELSHLELYALREFITKRMWALENEMQRDLNEELQS
jgi:hypothetical protein